VKVLVVGGSGSIGRPLVDALRRRGHAVVVLGRRKMRLVAGVAYEQGDVRDADCLAVIMRHHAVERVVNLAAVLGPAADTPVGVGINFGGAVAVLHAAAEAGVERVVQASSMAVYGPTRGAAGYPMFEPIEEEYPRRPDGLYGVAKHAAEEAGRVAAMAGGLRYCAVRFGPYYGPDKPISGRRGIGALISNALAALCASEPVRLPQWTGYRFHPVYVLDAVAALLSATLSPDLPAPIDPWVHVAGPASTTMGGVIVTLKEAYPYADIGHERPSPDDRDAVARSSCMVFDDSRARTLLGYRPRFGLTQAAQHFLAQPTARAAIERTI